MSVLILQFSLRFTFKAHQIMTIVALEGFQLQNEFILKELFIENSNREFRQFIFKAPLHQHLSEVDCKTIRFTTRHLSRLSYTTGDIPYTELEGILQTLKDSCIYTYGYTARNFLSTQLPTTVVIDIQELGYNMPPDLVKRPCFINHRARYCAVSKTYAIRIFLDNNNIEY